MNKITRIYNYSFYVVYLLFLIPHALIYSQNQEDSCAKWQEKIDEIKTIDAKIKFCKKILPQVSSKCRTTIQMLTGDFYYRKLLLDSSIVYNDKAIENAKLIGEEEDLSDAYNQKIIVLIKQEKHKEIYELLDKSRKILNSYPKSKSWFIYYEQNAYIAFMKSDYLKAMAYLDSTIIAARRSNSMELAHETYEHLGLCYLKNGDYQSAQEHLIKALELKEKHNILIDIDETYRYIADVYKELNQYDKAKYYTEKSILIAQKNNESLSLLAGYSRLGQYNRILKLNKLAEKALDSSIILANRMKVTSYLTDNLKEKGLLYYDNYKDLKKAEIFLEKAYQSAKSSKNKEQLYTCILELIRLYTEVGKYTEVETLFKETTKIKEDINTISLERRLHLTYSNYYKKTSQYKKAFIHSNAYHKLNDSLKSEKVFSKVAFLEKKYDTKKKEIEILNLNKEKENQQQQVQKAEGRQKLYLLAAGSLLLFLILGGWAFLKLRKQQQELLSTNQVKNRLFSIIAHDLRGMIIPFQRAGKIVKYHIDKGNNERAVELSVELEKNSKSLSNMLDNLLNWSLEQMNGYKTNPESIVFGKELQEVITSFEQQALYKNTKIQLQFEKEIFCEFDKGALHLIFRNLISNSLKYTQDGTIKIAFKKEIDTLLCSIIDTGIGMSQEQLKTLFLMEKGNTTQGTQGEKGTGLGLNLVYRFVQANKGAIKVSSEKRIGTRFDLSFPLKETTRLEKEHLEPLSA